MNRLFVVDLDRCFGCHACEIACKQEKGLPAGPRPMQVMDLGPRRVNGKVYRDFVPTFCCQCVEAYCVEICEAGALGRTAEGIVTLDREKCIQCELCVTACPYGFMDLDPVLSLPAKCDFCSSRLSKNLEASCVSHCPADALQIRHEEELKEFLSGNHGQRVGQVLYVSKSWKLSSPIIKREE